MQNRGLPRVDAGDGTDIRAPAKLWLNSLPPQGFWVCYTHMHTHNATYIYTTQNLKARHIHVHNI